MHDVIVIGAGFAGLCCAEAAAARGARTIVLERQSAPGERPRTTGILVKEISDAWDFPARLTRRIHGVRLYSPSLDYLDLTSPGYYFLATDTPGRATALIVDNADGTLRISVRAPLLRDQDVGKPQADHAAALVLRPLRGAGGELDVPALGRGVQGGHALGFRSERDFVQARELRVQIGFAQAGFGGGHHQRALRRIASDAPVVVGTGEPLEEEPRAPRQQTQARQRLQPSVTQQRCCSVSR